MSEARPRFTGDKTLDSQTIATKQDLLNRYEQERKDMTKRRDDIKNKKVILTEKGKEVSDRVLNNEVARLNNELEINKTDIGQVKSSIIYFKKKFKEAYRHDYPAPIPSSEVTTTDTSFVERERERSRERSPLTILGIDTSDDERETEHRPPVASSSSDIGTRYSSPEIMELALKMSPSVDEMKNIYKILSDLNKAVPAIVTRADEMRDLLATKPTEEYNADRLEQLIQDNPEKVETILEDIEADYVKGKVTKDEYNAIKKVIPDDMKNIIAFSKKSKRPTYKYMSKQKVQEIKAKSRARSRSQSPVKRYMSLIERKERLRRVS